MLAIATLVDGGGIANLCDYDMFRSVGKHCEALSATQTNLAVSA
jgi:hypothetical protein